MGNRYSVHEKGVEKNRCFLLENVFVLQTDSFPDMLAALNKNHLAVLTEQVRRYSGP